LYLTCGFLHSGNPGSRCQIHDGPEYIRLDEMKPKSTDIALLENALLAIEKVLAHADSNSQEAKSQGVFHAAAWTGDHRFNSNAAQSAANVCLSAAAALVDVSRTLIRARGERVPHDIDREWEAMITYTKIASRSAHRAALIMASQQGTPATHHAVSADSGERSVFAALSD
jgi:hypothetical protein